jgi:mono/diheme cytochrome c family protein
MPKPTLLALAGTLIFLLPAHFPVQGQSGQEPAPAQSQPAPAQPQPATAAPAPAMQPTQAVSPAPAAYPKNPFKTTADSQAKAKNLYQIDCSMCHNDNGDGKSDLATSMQLTLLDWTDPKSLAGRQDGELFLIIRNGKDKMPPETEGRASNEAIWNLVVYIRAFSKGQASAAAGAAK